MVEAKIYIDSNIFVYWLGGTLPLAKRLIDGSRGSRMLLEGNMLHQA